MESFLSQLNQSQRQAVEYNEGPSLVIAGAGSGKTRVLTFKIAYLLQQGISPRNVLALTFTNKASREMKERIAGVVGEETARQLWMGTFHSVFSSILRREADKLGFSSRFTIYDAGDSKNLIRAILKELNLNDKVYKPATALNRISNAKNALFTPEQYAANRDIIQADNYHKTPELKNVYRVYRDRCLHADAMDFDDLLLYTNILFRNHPEVLHRYQEQFRFLLVDEYQDTNYAQHLIVQQLAAQHRRVCVVGDDAQSIYSFRGANIGNILNFQDTYPEAKLFKLEQNYRSTQTIVNAANSLIYKNKSQIHKKVFSEKGEGEKIQVIVAYSDYEEGYAVASRIAEMRMLKRYDYKDFVILYRTNAQSRIFEEALRKRNIPYKIFGGLSFFHRKEIKDIVAYFKMAINPKDEEALKRTINYPMRGIGATTLGKISEAATRLQLSLWQIIEDPFQYGLEINAATAAKLAGYRKLILSFAEKSAEENACEAGKYIMQETGIVNELYSDRSPEGLSRIQNMEELFNSLNVFVENRLQEGVERVDLADFLAEVSLLTDQDTNEKETPDWVSIMTMHASKGLEFKNVFVTGLEEDLFPSAMGQQYGQANALAIEEERRLFYVAVTRAEENCLLSYAKSRMRHGITENQRPSRFLSDIDAEYLNLPDSMRLSDDLSPSRRGSAGVTGRSAESRFTQPGESDRTSPAVAAFRKTEKAEKNVFRRLSPSETAAGKPGKRPSQTIGLNLGDIILHERFGQGQVVALEGDRENAKATVEFDTLGRKQLLLKFAKFQIIG